MNALYATMIVLSISGLLIRTAYEMLKLAKKIDTRNKAVISIVFVGMCLMLLSWPGMSIANPVPSVLPGVTKSFGFFMAMMGVCLAAGGVLQLKGLENIDALVTTGLYSITRHPMYAGFLLWIAGWMIVDGSVIGIILGAVHFMNILVWRDLEEQDLGIRFGEEYRKYRNRTWF